MLDGLDVSHKNHRQMEGYAKINATKGALTSISTFNNGSNVLFTATGPASSGSYTGTTAHVSVTTLQTSHQITAACSSANGLKSVDVAGSTYFS